MSSTLACDCAAVAAAVEDAAVALERLGAVLAAAGAGDVPGLQAANLAGRLLGPLGIGEAVAAALGRRADASLELRAHGFLSLRSYLVAGVGLADGHASAVVARGRALERYPATLDAVLAGEVDLGTARVITEKTDAAVADLRGAEQVECRAQGERLLLELSRSTDRAAVARAGDKLAEVLDPQGAVARALRAFDRQTLSCVRAGDHYVLSGALPLDTGAGLISLLGAIVDQRFRTGSLREDEQPSGDQGADAQRRRHARSRLWAEAFDQLVAGVLDQPDLHGLGTRHGSAPHVTVIVEQSALAAGRGGDLLVPGDPDPVPVPRDTVQRLLCDADVTEVLVAGMLPASAASAAAGSSSPTGSGHAIEAHDLIERCGHVLCVGRSYRTATKAQRAALLVRDQHCAFPGCRVDVSRCQAHHIREWDNGGATCLSNLRLYCRGHHMLVHEGGWQHLADPALDPGHPRYWQLVPPDVRADSPMAGTARLQARARPPEPSQP